MSEESYRNNCPFLLMEGGPLFHLEKRVGTVRKEMPLTKRRAVFSIAITWLPLLILTLMQGTAYGREIPVPFLRDFSAYTRFLLGVPLLLLAENVLGPRIADTAEHFIRANLVLPADYVRFDEGIVRGLRRRDSRVAEVIIAVLAVALSVAAFMLTAVHASTWYALHANSGVTLTWAGWWYVCVSLPILQFLTIRWLWRLFVWFQFLAAMDRLDLQLYPTHPDHAGGLGFVGEAQRFFGIILLAFSCNLSGVIANEVLYNKMPLSSFGAVIAVYVFLLISILIAPLAVFSARLFRVKRVGLEQYGSLGTAYTGSFHNKWILGQNPQNEAVLGTSDIQSLADFGNSYGLIESMRVLPIDPRTLIHLVVAAILPMIPLLLTVMPFKEIIKLLLKLLG